MSCNMCARCFHKLVSIGKYFLVVTEDCGSRGLPLRSLDFLVLLGVMHVAIVTLSAEPFRIKWAFALALRSLMESHLCKAQHSISLFSTGTACSAEGLG